VKNFVYILIIVTGILFFFTGCGTTQRSDTQTNEPAVEESMEQEMKTIDPAHLIGIWQGLIKAGGQEVRLVFHFAQDGDIWKATVDSPDQGAEGIPVESVEVDSFTINVNIPAAAAKYEGEFDLSKSIIKGKWHQGGGTYAVDLERIEKVETVVRPQDPVPPFPYDEKEVTFPNEEAGITLAGTLTMPRTGGPFSAVILITGSGAQDRNEEVLNHRPFLVLADHLTRQGIAVLRYDDRGVGGSGGNPMTATSVDFAGDAFAAFTFLSDQPGIDAARTGIIGHSEGGIIAPMIASVQPEVRFLVLLAGSGVIGSDLLLMQNAAILNASGATEDQIKKANEVNQTIYEIVATESNNEKAAEKIGKILTGLGIPEDKLAAQISPLLTPWYRYFLSYDPAFGLSNTTCPVLAINGSLDVQVPADENLEAIARVLKEGGNDNVMTVKLDGLNHLFQHATTGLVQEYAQIEETFAPEALQIVSDWILDTTK
jgi:uncharacterized protein